jgi:cytochrome c553
VTASDGHILDRPEDAAPFGARRRGLGKGLKMPGYWIAFALVCTVAAAGAGSAAAAGDAKSGRQKALQCQACHGLDGQSKLPEAPNLAGQNEIYLVKALKDYRGGARKNEMMSLAAANLTDQDIIDLAAYYSAIMVTVGSPPR